ncbi:hypothetical protein ACFLX4_03805 [Chloroflexota bacterium]
MTKEVNLLVNDMPIPLDYFVRGFIDRTTGAMLSTLEGTGEIKTLEISIDGDNIAIILNNAAVPINFFVSKIFRNTIAGMLSPLKGVGEINKVRINIER